MTAKILKFLTRNEYEEQKLKREEAPQLPPPPFPDNSEFVNALAKDIFEALSPQDVKLLIKILRKGPLLA